MDEIGLEDCPLFEMSLKPSPLPALSPEANSRSLSTPDQNDDLTSFDMFGCNSLCNVRRTLRMNKVLKPLRLYLLDQVLQLCQEARIQPFVYGGTALSVFREAGQMIAHDTDIDLAVLEYGDDATQDQGAFGKLAAYCLSNSISLFGVRNLKAPNKSDSLVCVNLLSSIYRKAWLNMDSETGEIVEIPYNGSDCKRAKFYFTKFGLEQACDKFGLKSRYSQSLLSDPELVHVDLFTLSRHPQKPETHFRVNWNLPGIYDCLRKLFPIGAILPLRDCWFEQIRLMAPANLEQYLTIEYGYLGRDAQYDRQKQLYVPIPRKFRSKLPDYMRRDE